jgi:hypothetical protein
MNYTPAPTAVRIAQRTTRDPKGTKPRWTELVVYHDAAAADGRVWIAVTLGMSNVEGETTRVDQLATDSLERTLQHFVDQRRGLSTPGRIVSDQARAWAETHAADARGGPVYTDAQREDAITALFDLPTIGWTREHLAVQVDTVAAALGLTRAPARG